MRCILILVIGTLNMGGFCQPDINPVIEDEANEMELYFNGYMDNTLPIGIKLKKEDRTFTGHIYYSNSKDPRTVEGDVDKNKNVTLYEFDEYSRVSAIISGTLHENNLNWNWYSSDYGLTFPIALKSSVNGEKKVQYYIEKSSEWTGATAVLREELSQITINSREGDDLRWLNYSCSQGHCVEVRPNSQLSNPKEFVLAENKKEELFFYPDQEFVKKAELEYKNLSSHQFNYFYSFNFPITKSSEFNKWIEDLVRLYVDDFIAEVGKTQDENLNPADRLKKRAYGDFFITLVNKHLISGFMIFHGTESTLMQTVPFVFDLSSDKLIGVNNLFRKEFDYPFFLRRYIENKKRDMLNGETKIVKDLLKDKSFTHFILNEKGLLFFTDFNIVFGRRHVFLPFEEVGSFIDQRTVSNFIKRGKRK